MKRGALALALLVFSAVGPAKGESCGHRLAIGEWAERYRAAGILAASFLEWPHALECLTELPAATRVGLFDVGRCVGPDCRWAVESRSVEAGLDPRQIAPLAFAIDRFVAASYADRLRPPWDTFREELAAFEALPAAEHRALRESRDRRFRIYRATERFSAEGNPAYRARLDGDTLVFPDGAHRPVTRGFWGRRYVWVPYRDVLRTQEYEKSALVARYRESSGLGYRGFEGYLAPDGRVVIVDQHHRTTAYAQRYRKPGTSWEDTPLPFRLEKGSGGFYPTLTHWSILSGSHQVPNPWNSLRWRKQPEWTFLSADEREKLLAAAESDRWLDAVRFWYAKSTGLPPIAP